MNKTTELQKLAWGTDAGFYRLLPETVLHPATEQEVADAFAYARANRKTITFRAAGTSLSGQAISDSILLVVGKKWEKYEVLDGSSFVRLQPGIIGERVNEILKPYGRKFTPDPASIKSAMVGGIVMNNASGMSCGTHANSSRMLESARLMLPDGTVLDTGDESSKASFLTTHPDFVRRIQELRDRTLADKELAELIRQKYRIKNVTGLNIHPFVLYSDPFDIIAHLLVGSEGTLAFVSEVVMRTGVLMPCTASAMLFFADTRTACRTVMALDKTTVAAAEFFDRKALSAVESQFEELQGLPETASALLVKVEAPDAGALGDKIAEVSATIDRFELCRPYRFTENPDEYGKYWAMRSGIFPAVGSMRPVGTTCLIEDVAFPIDCLEDATEDLQQLLARNGYDDAVIYGHALEGNYHFVLDQWFDTPEEVERYRRMMAEVVDMVVDKYHGSLKAEHGTGRNMAPFVRREWGDAAYRLMQDVKQLFDPENILNPGVIFNEDPESHLRHIKPLPALHSLVDRCIECGFCEVNCVSCGFALSSRQRIVVQREIARLRQTGEDPARLRALQREFRRVGEQLCAGDGLCAMSCPVGINTGEYIHVLREKKHGRMHLYMAWVTAHDFSAFVAGIRMMLGIGAALRSVLGNRLMTWGTRLLRFITAGNFPLWTSAMPKPKSWKLPKTKPSDLKVVYFPSCINRAMGVSPGDPVKQPLMFEMTELLQKAGYEVIFPKGMENLCCGMIWESKGMPGTADGKAADLELALYKASQRGKYPVLCDQSPCLYRMRRCMENLQLYEPVEFIDKFLLDKLDITPIKETITIHATCSTIKMGLKPTLIKVARLCAENVLVPEEIGCCGFAGDKGFFEPELNRWALRKLRPQVQQAHAVAGYSNSRTCEIGLRANSGIPFMSIAYLVNKVSKPKKQQEHDEGGSKHPA